LKAQINKTDRNDARGIAQMMRAGLYRPVHVKTLRSQKLRMLLTHRKLLQSKAIAIENDLRGTLRNFGLKVGMVGKAKFEARIKELVENLEMSLSSWLVAGIVPGVERQPLKKLAVDESALLKLLHRWREEAEKAGRRIERIAVAFEAFAKAAPPPPTGTSGCRGNSLSFRIFFGRSFLILTNSLSWIIVSSISD
jgi:transposase